MAILKKLEEEFQENNYNTSSGKNPYDFLFSEEPTDEPLPNAIKKQIQDFIVMLQNFYDEKIDKSDATIVDALEYIPLFNINGLLIAAMLDVTMEEYYMATDYMIRMLGIEAEQDES